MNAIRIHRQLDSETLHLPELRPLIGKCVEIIVLEQGPVAQAQPAECFDHLPGAPYDPQALETMRPQLAPAQYEALRAIAERGGPDVRALAELRAASRS